ncbi:hypothetical protein TNCV_4556391 [Trichonephila clavipes]|nr:hypothetical protein TNCV_4556391 [Trichonephila clavipes]
MEADVARISSDSGMNSPIDFMAGRTGLALTICKFVAVPEMTGEYLTNAILGEFGKNGLDIQNCRGQGYDNGANMVAQKKKSKGLRSGEREGQVTDLLRPIYLQGYAAWRWLRSAIEKWAGVPSCINYTFWSVVAGTPCCNCGRSGKFTYEKVSSTLPWRFKSFAFLSPLSSSGSSPSQRLQSS